MEQQAGWQHEYRLLIHERVKFSFVTVCMVTIAPDRSSLRMRLAGHPPPLLRARRR